MQGLASRKTFINVSLTLFIVGIVVWQFRDSLTNPALLGDDYMNTARAWDLSLQAHVKGFLAPNNSYNNRPLGNLYYSTLFRIFGLQPFPYIAILWGLHIANAVLGFFLASRLLGNRLFGAICALAWAVHFCIGDNCYSANVIFDNLMFFWWTASLLLYLAARERENTLLYVGSIACFFLSTRSKEVGVVLPAALLGYEIAKLPWRVISDPGGLFKVLGRILRKQWPYYLIAIVFAAFYVWKSEWGFNSAPSHSYYMDLSYRAFTEGLKFYVFRATFEQNAFQSSLFLYLVFASAALWALLLRQKILIWALAMFVATLLPVIFFVHLRQQIYLYLPLFYLCLGCTGLIAHTATALTKRWGNAGLGVVAILMIGLFFFYWSKDRRYLGYISNGYKEHRAEARIIVDSIKRFYPAVPAGSRFYFVGTPYHESLPILLAGNLPYLLYEGAVVRSSLVSGKDEILSRESSEANSNFFCFQFSGKRIDLAQGDIIRDNTPELRKLKAGMKKIR